MNKEIKITMSQLEFNIYSNALVKIGQLLNDETIRKAVILSPYRFVVIPIESFMGAGCPFDTVTHDKEASRFTKIEYVKFVSKKKTRTFQIEIPETASAYFGY